MTATPDDVLVRISHLTKRFDGVTVVDDVSFDVMAGEILGVIGPNGCGKSVLFNCVLGRYVPDDGSVDLAGLGVTQLREVVETMSVRDNLRCAGRVLDDEVDRLIERFDLARLADQPASHLSYGQQKLLETAMALVRDPSLVLLDEPAVGVNRAMLANVEALIRDLNEHDGTTFVIVEHNMEFLFGLADRIVVMVEGSVLMTGTPDEVRADPRVVEAYLDDAGWVDVQESPDGSS